MQRPHLPMNRSKLLLIDDEEAIRRFLNAALPEDRFEIRDAADAASGLRLVSNWHPDIVLLDLGLPDEDGIAVTEQIRRSSTVPIIIISVRGQESEKVAALDAGADDYLTKPFGLDELLARIRVALRHRVQTEAPKEHVFRNGDLEMDFAARTVHVSGNEVHLTKNEFNFLALLARNSGRVVTHRQILRAVWGEEYETESHYVRLYMNQLRHKLEVDPARPQMLQTDPGVGYRLKLLD